MLFCRRVTFIDRLLQFRYELNEYITSYEVLIEAELLERTIVIYLCNPIYFDVKAIVFLVDSV